MHRTSHYSKVFLLTWISITLCNIKTKTDVTPVRRSQMNSFFLFFCCIIRSYDVDPYILSKKIQNLSGFQVIYQIGSKKKSMWIINISSVEPRCLREKHNAFSYFVTCINKHRSHCSSACFFSLKISHISHIRIRYTKPRNDYKIRFTLW